MKRFYWTRSGERILIFDRAWSNTDAIARAYDDNVAEMIVQALNRFWEQPQ